MDEQDELDASIGKLSKDLLRLAIELQAERWENIDAQNWYVNGVNDSAHLLMLKWIDPK